jgi:arylsulfatase A-like enzyme
MRKVRNFLFIMYDQLRPDYLGCYGHPVIDTPAFDSMSRRGVLFSRAYCQSPVCGSSRMSFYTGRYPTSHGTTWNNVPLRLSELTMGDYLRPLGYRVAVVGESHFVPDLEGMARAGLSPNDGGVGALIAQGGFEPWDRDDQLHPDSEPDLDFRYNLFLKEQGYGGRNPWHEHANSALGPGGEMLSGWYMRNAHLPSRVREEHSETAYFTDRAMAFIDDAGEQPWCLHLSYMKPHWPYMAPAPYHDMYRGENDVLSANRTERELHEAHPVVRAFMNHDDSQSFRDEAHRRHVIPTYMGLIRQLDDHLARLVHFLEVRGRMNDTLIVLTSDHGGYLGDHWLGEKELFHEESVRIPMIVVDPSPEADARRGERDDRLVESIDLLPTFLDSLGQPAQPHRLEGRSLRPLLHGQEDVPWRDAAFSEHDYAFMRARRELGLQPHEARSYMVRTDRWKYVHYEHFRPQLFDLQSDPMEQNDLGADPSHAAIRGEMSERLFQWFRTRAVRSTMSDETVERRTATARERGIIIEIW